MIYLITGGCGFIGSNFLNRFVPENPNDTFINIDCLTYAGNPDNVKEIAHLPNYMFSKTDISDKLHVESLFLDYSPDVVVHFAANSHVDRSIADAAPFIQTNIVGTYNLLEAARGCRAMFHHVSTDEVFGSLGDTGFFTEESPYRPNSPYAASKAASDHLVRAYSITHKLDVTISNCSNNYGPRQHAEKMIPTVILAALSGKTIPVYGKGLNVRDWVHVSDHIDAVFQIINNGVRGETYCVGGGPDAQVRNIDLVHMLCRIVADETGRDVNDVLSQIAYVTDRKGHDFRYAISDEKIRNQLGWKPMYTLEQGLRETVQWYIKNKEFVITVQSRGNK